MTVTAIPWDQFEHLSTDASDCITWASRGPDGSGKSWLGATAPGPIFVCAFDPHGMARVDPEIRATKEIRIGRYGFAQIKADRDATPEQKKALAREIWEQFIVDYKAVLPHVRSVLWDREDLGWELLRYAKWGMDKNSGSKTGQLDYGELNTEYMGLIQLAKDHHVNLGLLQGLAEEWISKPNFQKGGVMERHNTGKLIPDGHKKVPDLVDITLLHYWDEEQREYMTKIGKFPQKEWKDQAFPNLDFATMATMAFPTTSTEDWQ